MTDEVRIIAGEPILVLGPDGPIIADGGAASDIIGLAFSGEARLVAVPVQRLDPSFFKLASGLAGEVLQKFVNYGFRVAILGDVSAHAAKSAPLTDFIRESNRGAQVWFLTDLEALRARLEA